MRCTGPSLIAYSPLHPWSCLCRLGLTQNGRHGPKLTHFRPALITLSRSGPYMLAFDAGPLMDYDVFAGRDIGGIYLAIGGPRPHVGPPHLQPHAATRPENCTLLIAQCRKVVEKITAHMHGLYAGQGGLSRAGGI